MFDMDYVSDSVFEEILTSVLKQHFPEVESLTEHQKKSLTRSHKSQGCVVRHTANQTWKINYISVALWCLQIPVPVRLFIPSSWHNFGCVSSKSLVDSHIRELRNRGISAASLSSEDKKLMSFYSEVPSPSYKTSKWRNMLCSNV